MPAKDAGQIARLFVLGTLDDGGPAHGHEIRRLAERIDVENWSEARIGSIYNAIRRLEAEQLIEAVRVEQEGRRPARTVYAITDAGRRDLATLRDKLLYEVSLASDPFNVALWVSSSRPVEELLAAIERRSGTLRERLAQLRHERERLTSAGYLPAVGELLFRHGEILLEAELEWHREAGDRLGQRG